mmetsp:Transcript_83194/g.217243  ORF Transcript_83194/g.217243 Transcript_83194/m.217243 type:complete len:327 (-) Transcript_83194:95-1075(-)
MRLCAVALALAGALPTRALRAQNGTLGGGPEQGQREASEASWFKKIYFLHLAKTAGGSALLDLPRHLSMTTQLNSYECCWPRFSGLDAWEPPAVITFMREPKAHVYSQWNHCRKNLDHWFNPRGLPANFSQWLRYWSKVGDHPTAHERGFHCYIPINLQARALSCRATVCPLVTHAVDEAVLHDRSGELAVHEDLATRRLQSVVRFVGLTEFYQESMCLLHAMSKNSFPSYCNCEDHEAWGKFPHASLDHGGGTKTTHTLSKADAELVENLTRVDARLYQVAMGRFMEAVHEVEGRFGKKVFCRDRARDSLGSDTVQLFEWDRAGP